MKVARDPHVVVFPTMIWPLSDGPAATRRETTSILASSDPKDLIQTAKSHSRLNQGHPETIFRRLNRVARSTWGIPSVVQLHEGFSLLVSRLRRGKSRFALRPPPPGATTSRIASYTTTRLSAASTRIVSLYQGGGLSQLASSGLIAPAPRVVPINAPGL